MTTETVTISDLPSGSTETSVVVPGVQDGVLRQHTLPESVFHPTATKENVRTLSSPSVLVTPESLAAVITPIHNLLDNFWSSWVDAGEANTGTKGGALNFDEGATEVSSAAELPASPAAGDLIIVDTTFTHSSVTYNADSMYEWNATDSTWDLVAAFHALTSGQDARTQSLGTGEIAVFYDTAAGLPVIQGDTLRMGVVADNSDGRVAIVNFTDNGDTAWKVVANAWQRMTSDDDPEFLQNATGIRVGTGWWLTPIEGQNTPITTPRRHWLIKRETARLLGYSIGYTSGDSATYDLHQVTRAFSSTAATITAATIRASLEGLSGNDRLDGSAVKNMSVSVPDFSFHCAGASAQVPATADSVLGDIMFVYQGFTHANLGDSSYAFTRGVFYKYSAAVNSDPAGWRPQNGSNAVYNQPGIPASALDSEQFAPDRLATSGAVDKVLTWKDSSTMEWRAPQALTWTRIANATSDVAGQISGITTSLLPGQDFADYDHLYFWGKGAVGCALVPAPLFALSTSTQPINIAFGRGQNNNGMVSIYRIDADSFQISSNGPPNLAGTDGLQGIWGGK